MRHSRLAVAALAAVAGLSALTLSSTLAQPKDPQPAAKQAPGGEGAPDIGQGAAPAAQPTQVPVKQVVLFSSGVGYFEHFGSVQGDGSTELQFKTQQINDILKSLVLQDLDGGRVSTVTYPSQDPVSKTLRSFQVDITTNPGLAELFNQLRGAKVSVTTSTAQDITGTVLGVEKKPRPIGDKDKQQVVEVSVLNLISGTSIRSVMLDDISDIRLEDPQLREELEKALAAVAQARDQDKKPVTINFRGEGERRVRVGYVVETPIWKTSYRLILGAANEREQGGAGEGEREGGKGEGAGRRAEPGRAGPDAAGQTGRAAPDAAQPRDNPDRAKAAAGAAQEPLPGDGQLQGWAIVENQTDSDWTDVQLSLVSGRPISFIQDLYQPLYIARPVVQPELYASLRPQTYDAGMDLDRKEVETFARRDGAERAKGMRGGMAGGGGFGGFGGRAPQEGAPGGTPPPAPMAAEPESASVLSEELAAPMDASASVASIASAAKVGELFQYTVGSVSLPRQKSAMIPIVTDAVEIERLSIYNQSVLPKNPLNGARVRNTTGKHLLQGPVTVLDAGAYAGDARIDDVPPGQERLLSYGVDQQVLVDATKNRQDSAIQTGKIVKGVLHVSFKEVFVQEYVAENKGDKDKTLLIEHPVRPEWKLIEPAKADETTEVLYRFKGKIAPGKLTKLAVRQEHVRGEAIAILPCDIGQLAFYARSGGIPKPVRDALANAMAAKQAMTETERQIQLRQQKIAEVTQEQTRLRENMKTVAQQTEYYKRLLKKLDEQETGIETLQAEVVEQQKKLEAQRADLEKTLNELNVG